MKKFLIISSWAPPIAGGAEVMLRQLLHDLPSDSYAVLTERINAFAGLPMNGWLPAPHYFLGTDRALSPLEAATLAKTIPTSQADTLSARIYRAAKSGADTVATPTKLRQLVRLAIRTVQNERAAIVYATSGDPVFMVAAALAARSTGRPLYAHLFDLFARNRYSLPKRILAASTERAILRHAQCVFVPNEAMASHYRSRIGIEPTVIPNGTRIPPVVRARPASGSPTILYTGSIYWAQRDNVRNLTKALDHLPGVRFEVKTRASNQTLMRLGVRGEVASSTFTDQDETLQAQGSSDLLFLPLTFQSAGRDVVATALPAKTAEYLASGTPILVHAPAYAYISKYARSAGWGYVVDTPDPNELVTAIRTLMTDFPLRESLVTAAYREASRAHDVLKIRAEFASYFV